MFHPKSFDTDNWCESLLLAGIRGCIITAKHHDGFCLWDSAYTNHTVTYTPYGKDIVRELSISCRRYGIKLGIYISPWDRHEKTYGMGKAYDDYFCNQLEELMTNYGKLYTIWFDGACGEGENGKKQIYDWNRYYELIRKLQPNTVISVSGPDVRWCGNEAGECRESEWSVVSEEVFSQSEIAKASQTEDSLEFRNRLLDVQDKDLGSRNSLRDSKNLIWYPAEVDTSIRPGWFYHESEDGMVRGLEELINIYLKSVGGNSLLLLNVPPHKDGYITENDRQRLKELGDFIRDTFRCNIGKDAKVELSLEYVKNVEKMIVGGDKRVFEESQRFSKEYNQLLVEDETYLELEMFENQVCVDIKLDRERKIRYLVLKEHIAMSQRVEKYIVEAIDNHGRWSQIYEGTVIGYKKICVLQPVNTRVIRIRIKESRKDPVLQFIGLYEGME